MKPDRATLWMEQFALMVTVWPFLAPTTERVLVWEGALQDLDEQQVREGVSRLLSNHGGTTPTPGNLRDAALGKVTWKAVRHDVTGQIIGRTQVREQAEDVLPAPLTDPDREPLALPGALGKLVDGLSANMAPSYERDSMTLRRPRS